MKLIFDIIKNVNDSSDKPNFHFDEDGGYIGRTQGATWVLEDDYISSKHLVIEFKDNAYYAIDVSTNGTYLKFPNKKLPKNQAIKINNTDIFILGKYEIQARFFNNDFTSDDLVSKKITLDDDFTSTVSNMNSNSNIIPDDFSLLDDNKSSTLIDDIEEDDTKDGILDNFDDIEESNNNLNDIYSMPEHHSIDSDIIEEESISNNALNEHITMPRFEEVVEKVEEVVKEPKEVKQIHKSEVVLNMQETAHKVNEMEAMSSLLLLEKKLGMNIVKLSQYERDIVLSEIAQIVLNSLDGLKNTLKVQDDIKEDILKTSRYKKNSKDSNKDENINPIKLGQQAINILDISSNNSLKLSDAINKSFNEIDIHNIALHNTSKSLINISLDKFAPNVIELNFQKRGKTLPFIPQSVQIWKEYKKMYNDLKENNSAIELIEKDFIKEYKKESNNVKLKDYGRSK